MSEKSNSEMKAHFINWFLSIPDVDETLVSEEAQSIDGFVDETVITLYDGFKAGFDCGKIYGRQGG